MSKLSWIPLPLAEKAVSESLHREVALYLFLKHETDGYIKLTGANKQYVLAYFNITDSTLYRRLSFLKERDWIGHDPETCTYFVRGYSHIYKTETEFVSNTAVEFNEKALCEFEVYAFAAVIGYLVKHQIKQQKRRGNGQKKRCPNQAPVSTYQKVAISALEQILNRSYQSIVNLKKHALKSNYLKRKKTYIEICDSDVFNSMYYKAYPSHWGRVRKLYDKIVLVGIDQFECQLRFKSKRYI